MHPDNCKPASSIVSPLPSKSLLCWFLCVSAIPINALAAQNMFWDMCKENRPGFLQCEEVEKICPQVQSAIIPVKDKPTEREKQELQGCSSDKLYFGYGKPSDPVKARKCAYLQIERNHLDGAFDGNPILMTVYANGEGVKRNVNLALRFACEDEGSTPAEYENRILDLYARSQNADEAVDFDYCAGITSGLMMGWCASRDAEKQEAKRAERLTKLLAPWSESDKMAFEKMLPIWRAFLNASENEVDQSGSGRASFSIEHREGLTEDFYTSLSKFNEGNYPNYSDMDFTKADSELNDIYKKIQNLSSENTSQWGTVTKEGIKNTQRAWLKFRNTWIVFAKQKYPSVSTAAWKVWLTRERVEQLKSFTENP